jgi:Uncharacterised nucleotidyltransferase
MDFSTKDFMSFSTEQKLIIFCSQARTSSADLDRIKALSTEPIDWQYIFNTANTYGMAPLLYYNIKKVLPNHKIPSRILDQLKEVYLINAANNTYSFNELSRLLLQFSVNHFDVLVLKGSALENMVYPLVGLRMYGDIDILVKKKDLPAIKSLLPKLGYVPTNYPKEKEQFWKDHYHLVPYIHPDKNITLEIHWNVTNRFPLNIDSWWQKSRITKIKGHSVRVFSPYYLFLHLCIHTSKHGFKNIDLRDLCDISETIKCYGAEIDWALFRKEIENFPIDREVYSIIYYVKRMYCSNENCLNWLTYHAADLKLVSLLDKLLFCDDRDSILPDNISPVLLKSSPKDKFGAIMNNLFPDREFMSRRYSLPLFSKRIYLYYLIRPFAQIIKNCKYIGQFIIFKAKEFFLKASLAFRKND